MRWEHNRESFQWEDKSCKRPFDNLTLTIMKKRWIIFHARLCQKNYEALKWSQMVIYMHVCVYIYCFVGLCFSFMAVGSQHSKSWLTFKALITLDKIGWPNLTFCKLSCMVSNPWLSMPPKPWLPVIDSLKAS